jgi:Type IV secretion-system coupling protein DNA-binding domain
MKPGRESLKRGQGLFVHDLSARLARLRTYGQVTLVSALVLGTAFPYKKLDDQEKNRFWKYAEAQLKLAFAEGQAVKPFVAIRVLNGHLQMRADRLVKTYRYEQAYELARNWATFGGLLGFGFGAFGCVIWSRLAQQKGEEAGKDNHLRGARLDDLALLKQSLKPHLAQGSFSLSGVNLPADFANRHIALVATTGAGKTTVLRELIDQAEKRGEAAIIYDTSGEFIAQYYNPERGDVILDPMDERGCFWDLMGEAKGHPADAEHIANKLIPEAGDNTDSVWTDSARSVVANVIRKLVSEDKTTLADLSKVLQTSSAEDLAAWLGDTSSARIFSPGSDRATASVLFSLTQALETLKFLKHEDSGAQLFTFREYFQQLDQISGPKPLVFVPRRESHFESLKPLLACWLELAAVGIMALPPNPRRRVWMMLDELPDIPKVVNLQRLLPQGRKFGACVVITFQAIGQMRMRYKADGAEALLANCNTKLILQCADFDTRKWSSQLVGEAEAELRDDSSSLGFEVGKGQTTIGRQRQIRPAILESEFKLPKYTGFLLLPDAHPVTKITLSNSHIIARGPAKQPGFVEGKLSDTLWGRIPKEPNNAIQIDYSKGPV